MIKEMKDGSVIVDIAIDQGGILKQLIRLLLMIIRLTLNMVSHYAVANMPGAVPRTSTIGLNNATLPYALLANKGYREAFKVNHPLSLGLNTFNGHVTNKNVADTFNFEYTSIEDALK